MKNNLTNKTITDFGEQWNYFTENSGYYGSIDVLKDIFGPLLNVDEIVGKKILDVGAGTGRISNLLLDNGAEQVIAVEPSDAFSVLQKNTVQNKNQIICIKCRGDEIPLDVVCDVVLSIGVIHHIPEPLPVLKRCHDVLKSDGKILIWVYGREGNETYLSLILPLRTITRLLPHSLLLALSHFLCLLLMPYEMLCKYTFVSWPMKKYFSGHFSRLKYHDKVLTIYDQLNPEYAKYYTKNEVCELLQDAGFSDVKPMHRHGYSWTVSGTKRL